MVFWRIFNTGINTIFFLEVKQGSKIGLIVKYERNKPVLFIYKCEKLTIKSFKKKTEMENVD